MRKILAYLFAAGVGAVAVTAGMSAPANAASYNIENSQYSRSTYNSRCEVSLNKAFCLWYSYTSSESGVAYYGSSNGSTGIANLINTHFSSSGNGAGQVVKNNSAAMDCTIYISDSCYSYFNSNYAGNSDYTLYGAGGRLNYTWNDNASFYLY